MFISLVCLGFFMVQRIGTQVGGQEKPSLSALLSRMAPLGGHVNLQCQSHRGVSMFRLYKEDRVRLPELQGKIFQNKLFMGPVTTAHAGTYRHQVSTLTHPLCGVYRKPFLAHPGSLVKSGGSIILQCFSKIVFQAFILHKEGLTKDPLYLIVELDHEGSPANFFLGPMTPLHAGMYNFYGSVRNFSSLWSATSDPMDIMIT
ncbi:killer cell immunoglobulin-like receptor 3DL3, partial [Carlito syrichta]|uniref:Killer cell immunoglobulin-like receptor 3DL3 n=1 Tax=Carlito syrichta TaxID=1868482 RepID=A0A3Q0DPS4_CARSF